MRLKYDILNKEDLQALTEGEARKFKFLVKNILVNTGKAALYASVLKKTEQSEILASSYLGTPIWDNLILDSEDIKLRIDMVLITVSQSKNIIKTSIQGLNGTVKEYISDGDYTLQINGAIFSDKNTNEYPEDDVLKLIRICRKQETIRVESKFLNRLDIDDIVIENYKLTTKAGVNNVQFFTLNAVSDTPKELIFRG